ncbi:MAG: PrsW family glutamic-type intramembrane protease [Leptospiraceae bacterium]|nr:PrsW family glutamic-type intramembrane protease [Leptospiraceae bacterium]
MEIFLLIALSLVPGIMLLVYILYMDRNEKEPIDLVIKTMGLGALSVIPAVIIELAFGEIHPIFNIEQARSIQVAFLQSFIQIAPVEEFCKLIVVLLFIWKNPEFNEENDGIVYVSASALGFAVLENVFYVMAGGFSVGVARAISAMPLHCFTGVIMGYFVGLAKFSISRNDTILNIVKGYLIAVLIHGLYDTFALSGTTIALLILPTIAVLCYLGLKILKKGRELSLARWGDTSIASVAPSIEENFVDIQSPVLSAQINPVNIKSNHWKIWISRPLLFFSAMFWLLIILGLTDETTTDTSSVLGGSVILTAFPIIIGVFLEFSYFSQRKLQQSEG